MYWIPILAAAYLLFNKNEKENKYKPIKNQKAMANCNKLFLDFNRDLSLTKTKKDRLIRSKNDLRDRIRHYFKKHHPEYTPEFYIQGSYKMKTVIRTKDDECDLDDGVYFYREEGVTGTTLQGWIKKAIKGAADTSPEHRKKCVRQNYKGDYHIDFPVYYFPEDEEHPQLAVKNEDCEESDPKELVDWFRDVKDKEGQLIRIIKYLKSWGDYKRNKMPSGLVMTILAEDNIAYNERDDIALRDTLINIEKYLDDGDNFYCEVPATPFDDLFEDYDDARKNNFLTNLTAFVDDAEKAVNSKNQLEASKLWKKHLGNRFPLGKNEDVDAKEAVLRQTSKSILAGTAHTKKDGTIGDNGGVKNKKHTNYGA